MTARLARRRALRQRPRPGDCSSYLLATPGLGGTGSPGNT